MHGSYVASSQSLFFPRKETRALRAGEEKEGPGTHCLRVRHKNHMNLIIKGSRDANLRHT